MGLINWDKRLETGHGKIDEQHRRWWWPTTTCTEP